jgi:hypothetical protein
MYCRSTIPLQNPQNWWSLQYRQEEMFIHVFWVLSWLNMYEIRIANCVAQGHSNSWFNAGVSELMSSYLHSVYISFQYCSTESTSWRSALKTTCRHNTTLLFCWEAYINMIRSKQQLVHTSLDKLVTPQDMITALEASPYQSYSAYSFPHNNSMHPFSIPEIMQQKTGNYWQMNR